VKRAVVTGIGLVTPLAIGTEATWDGLVNSKSAIGPVTAFDPSSLRCQLGGEIRDFVPEEFANRRMLRMMTRNDQLALAGATLALRNAGLEVGESERGRVAVYVGTNKTSCNPEFMSSILVARGENGVADVRRIGERISVFYPFFYIEGLPAASLFYISSVFGFMGPNAHFTGGSEAALTAVGRAYRSIQRGEADVAVAGGFDDPVSWWNAMPRFEALGILTDRNDLGSAACRPYDCARTGTVLGEASAFLVLEERSRACERGVRTYAEITGYGSSYDPPEPLAPSLTGEGVAQALRTALREADTAPEAIDYVCAGGNGSLLADAREARGLADVFGESRSHAAVSSVKAAIGECLAGSGALNAAVAALAIHHQTAPPTLNLDCPDPERDLEWIRGAARGMNIRQAAASAQGLEGSNVALVMSTVSQEGGQADG
jgi:3-oxoacyl-[acyl-carrier-protein] synthase II